MLDLECFNPIFKPCKYKFKIYAQNSILKRNKKRAGSGIGNK